MRYSIHRALGELKVLDKRIEKEIKNGVYIGFKKKSVAKESQTGKTVKQFGVEAKAVKQSVDDLINRRRLIKEAIVNSNATTLVVIGGKEMTVASAIERKTSIEYDTKLLSRLKSQYNKATSTVSLQNEAVESDISSKIDIMLGAEKSKNQELVNKFSNDYRESNSWELVDPLGLKEVIDKLEEEIITFENEVDVVLSESNATTFIEIE